MDYISIWNFRSDNQTNFPVLKKQPVIQDISNKNPLHTIPTKIFIRQPQGISNALYYSQSGTFEFCDFISGTY